MVLSDRSIKEELAKGRIAIKPLDPSCIQPASVDIHLGSTFRVFRPWQWPHQIDTRMPLDGLTELVEIEAEHYFSLAPGQFVLGTTLEYLEVPDDLMARLEGKSSLGRIGLLIHATAGYVDPGWQGHLTLELSNASTLSILLYPNMKISQISFHRLTTPVDRPYGSPELGSKYQGQVGPTATRSYQEFEQPSLLNLPSFPVTRKPKASRNGDALKDWLKQSGFRGNVKQFAEALEVPLRTVEDWLYHGAEPKQASRAKLFTITRLPQFKVDHMLSEPALPPNPSSNP